MRLPLALEATYIACLVRVSRSERIESGTVRIYWCDTVRDWGRRWLGLAFLKSLASPVPLSRASSSLLSSIMLLFPSTAILFLDLLDWWRVNCEFVSLLESWRSRLSRLSSGSSSSFSSCNILKNLSRTLRPPAKIGEVESYLAPPLILGERDLNIASSFELLLSSSSWPPSLESMSSLRSSLYSLRRNRSSIGKGRLEWFARGVLTRFGWI